MTNYSNTYLAQYGMALARFVLWHYDIVNTHCLKSDCQSQTNGHIPVAVEELQCLFRIFKATACSPIRQRASATAFHVGRLAFRSQWLSISTLQRSLPSTRKSWLIVRSSWSSNPNLTPSKCQFTTEFNAFERSIRVGEVGAGEGEKTRSHSPRVQ